VFDKLKELLTKASILVSPIEKEPCWWSLMLIFIHQLLLDMTWYEPQSIVVGFETNEFHEFWWIYVLQGLN
jgi:hypothetical protein